MDQRRRRRQDRCDDQAHQAGVVHRDLKPSNILVDPHGQPKILDFGIAFATDSDARLTTIRTEVGQIVGTLAYMSPEQLSADTNKVDARSDVCSLGVCLFELLVGRLPHDVNGKLIHESYVHALAFHRTVIRWPRAREMAR